MESNYVECPSCYARVRRERSPGEPRNCPECGERLFDRRALDRKKPERRGDWEDDRDGGRGRSRRGHDREGRGQRERPRSKAPWVILSVLFVVILVVCGSGGYLVVVGTGKVSDNANSMFNLRDVTLAAHKHNDKNGFAPANVVGPDGKPLLSWRVALLPELGEDELYRQFHHDEPWDSPHNLTLLKQMPRVYAHPGKPSETSEGLTFYQGFSGPGTMFDPTPGHKIAMDRIPDGTANTIFLAEAHDPVPWTKPADIPYDPKGPLPTLGAGFSESYPVATCDSGVHLITRRVSEQTLRAAITYNDGMVLGADWPGSPPARRQKIPRR
jgi:hypothetical protein